MKLLFFFEKKLNPNVNPLNFNELHPNLHQKCAGFETPGKKN